jgi:hypothetical protein
MQMLNTTFNEKIILKSNEIENTAMLSLAKEF